MDLCKTPTERDAASLERVDPADYTCDSYEISLDGDWDHGTDPKLYRVTGISLVIVPGHVYLVVTLPDTGTPGLIAKVDKEKSVSLNGEVSGYNGGGAADGVPAEFTIQFTVTVRNRVFRPGEPPEDVQNDPLYLSNAQVRALIAEATRSTTPGPANTLAIGTVAEGDAPAATITGSSPNQTLNLVLKTGAQGNPGPANTLAVGTVSSGAYPSATITGASPNQTLNLVLQQGPKGDQGDKGAGIEYDKNGEISERAAYDDELKGFRYASTVTDSTAKTSTLYIWTKLSDEHADWSDPLVLTVFEREKAIAVLKPVEFSAPTDGSRHLELPLSAYPAATVAAVCIDRPAGELLLPYDNARGITEIVKDSDKVAHIYFGTLVPEYATGRIYLTQFLGLSSGAVNPDIPNPTPGTMHYGYITSEVAGALVSVTQITGAILEATISAGTIISGEAGTLGKTSLGTVPEGAFIVALVPATSSLSVTKFDGIGGQVVFNENNGLPGTGANGTEITIGETTYRVYGEFKLNEAEIFIYIDEVTNA
ncbi:MAG: hypothetical protein BWY06_03130 [Candidatus Latescibacteria bacterium ADurb.Bin168]|nr:MAG: hypothetical protein BWY06_03130 [Candidatus Latescibacteria bacterium ADurb.Bin168]